MVYSAVRRFLVSGTRLACAFFKMLQLLVLAYCILGVASGSDVTTPSASGVPDLCLNEGILAYGGAPPNTFNLDVSDYIENLQGLINSGCSDILARFVCTAHLPRLDLVRYGLHGEEVYLRPCVEVCRDVWRDCRSKVRQLRIRRPQELDCSKHYLSEKKDSCLSYLHPPQHQPMVVNGTRLNASSVSILYTPPYHDSKTQAFLVNYNDTASRGEAMFATATFRSHNYHTMNITDLPSEEAFSFNITALNSFGKGLWTVMEVPAYRRQRCEDITVPLCTSGVDYQHTAVPNLLGHQSQEIAGLEIHQFYPLVKVGCSPVLRTFLCATYIPRCTRHQSRPIPPCRELCEQARNGCKQQMMVFGFSWPESMNCDILPSFHDVGTECYLGGTNVTDIETDDQCEDITVSWCPHVLGYNQTSLSNSRGHMSKPDAEMQLQTFIPLIQSECSPHLSSFLCSLYLPRCNSEPIPPCRELCELARSGCLPMLLEVGFQWPEGLACEALPSHGDGATCYLGGINVTDVETDDQCEDITVSWCPPVLGYNQTSMANIHPNMSKPDAEMQLQTFTPFIQSGCSPHMSSLLCSLYLPRCNSEPIPPCRELCELARSGCLPMLLEFGFQWPEGLACEALPSHGDGATCYLGGTSDMGLQCEDITVPMCKSGLDYQQTAMPNPLRHQSQEEASLEVHQFYPLVEVGCSPFLKTFLCAMYTPRCTSHQSHSTPPCRELCNQARNGCENLMTEYGFSWPERLNCEILPSLVAGTECYLGGAPVPAVETNECEDITVSWCPPAVGYNQTSMPNSLGHMSQTDAEMQLQTFAPLIQYRCSPHMKSLLCSLYLPSCNSALILPCRELCEVARDGCLPMLLEFGFQWPEGLACEALPSHGDGATCYLGAYQLMPVNENDFGPSQFNETTVAMTVKPRRYDIYNLGVPSLFQGWVDVQGQGAANDYCRVVMNSTGGHFLSCSLAGMEGAPTDLNYNNTGPWFDAGHMNTWYMRDVNEDGRDDYCRCVGCLPTTHVSCLLAGEGAFTAQTFNYDPVPGGCHYKTVNPYFGR